VKCTKCGRQLVTNGKWWVRPSHHHVYPVRWFGKGKQNRMKVMFCGGCHRELETIINGVEERLIAMIIKQKELSRRPSKGFLKRFFQHQAAMYLQMANDYVVKK